MHYLQRSMLEDADVQTNIFVYRETGTESTPKEQKSTCVSATFKFGSRLSCNGNESGKPASLSSASKSKNSNLGKSSLVQQIKQEKLSFVGKENDVDNFKSIAMMCSETHKAQNHIFTQAFSSHFLRDSKHIYGKKLVKEESIAENFIEISEVNTDDKDTGTEDIGCLMQDNVTSTVLHLDSMRQSWESQNVDTQMQIICNNAETDVVFPQTRDLCSTSVLTSLSGNAALYKPGETNTEIHDLRSNCTMTIPEMNSSPTFHIIETQVTPVPSLKMKSTANFTSKSFRQGLKPAKIDMSTIVDGEIKYYFRDYAIQVMPHMESFLGSDKITKSTSTTAMAVQEAYAVMSMKEFDNTGVSVSKAHVQSANCLTSSSLQACKCPHIEIASQYTSTDDEQTKIMKSKNKLESFLNTGILINSLMQTALSQNRSRVAANPSIGLDTISIGKKYTSEIATCTNSELKGPVIEKEKERFPDKMSNNTSTFVNQRSQSTEHSASNSLRAVAVGGYKMDNSTQYSNMQQKILDTVSCRTERIGNSHLISVRMLSHSAEETSVQTESAHSNDIRVYTPPQYKCTSVFTSQCALDQPITTLPDLKDFVHKDIGMTSSLNTSQGKPDIIRNAGFRLDSSEVLSSNLDADKWIKSCIEKGYQSQLEEKYGLNENAITSSSNSSGYKKRRSKSVASATQSESQKVAPKVTALTSVITDNMALEKYDKDLVPTKESSSDKQIVEMVDHVTSDEVVKKDVREITLQACPENVEAATECKQTTLQKSIECIQSTEQKSTECSEVIRLKSACVFTSRCILPPPSLCKCHLQNSSFLAGDCVFVYGKPKCVVHSPEEPVYTKEKGHSRNRTHVFPVSNTTYDITKYQEQRLRSMGVLSSSTAITSSCNKSKMMSPKEYEALYEKRLCEEAKIKRMKKLYKVYGIDAEVEARMFHASGMQSISMVTTPADVRSAAAFTSQCKYCEVVKNDQIQMTQDPIYSFVAQSKETGSAETSDSQSVKMLEIPTHDDDPEDCDEFKEENDKAYLVGCRYYSTLLSKQLDRVRENITKHLSPFTDSTYEIPIAITECTMKPSAREELGCQTKNQPNPEMLKFTPTLSPAISTTDIGQHDKEYLKSVYYMLTAIEGRLRRFKTNMY